jgi:hypothetical protein
MPFQVKMCFHQRISLYIVRQKISDGKNWVEPKNAITKLGIENIPLPENLLIPW